MYIQKQEIPDWKMGREKREPEQYRRDKTMYFPYKREENNFPLPDDRDEIYWTQRPKVWSMASKKREKEQYTYKSNVTSPIPTNREVFPKKYIDVGSNYEEELKNQKKVSSSNLIRNPLTKTRELKNQIKVSLSNLIRNPLKIMHFFQHSLEKERQKEMIEEHQEDIIEAEEVVAEYKNMLVDKYIDEGKTRRRKPLPDPDRPIVPCPYCKFKSRTNIKVVKHVLDIHKNELEARREESKLKKPIKVSTAKRMTFSSPIITEVHIEPTATDDSANEGSFDVTDHEIYYDTTDEVSTQEHNASVDTQIDSAEDNTIKKIISESNVEPDNETYYDAVSTQEHNLDLELSASPLDLPKLNNPILSKESEGHWEDIDSVQILEVFPVRAAEEDTIRKIAIAESNVKPVYKTSFSLIWKNIKKVKIVNHILCTQSSI